MSEIKAIETVYKGYKFRSRLEARWAVFFTEAGIKFEYEQEGFNLGEHGYYLPDFFLPEINGGIFVEIKATKESFGEDCEKKAEALAIGTGRSIVLCCGFPEERDYGIACSNLDDGCHIYTPTDDKDDPIWWDNCQHFQGGPTQFYLEYGESNYDHGCHSSIRQAARSAKMARFEYGENG